MSLLTNIKAYWKFDESSGNALDATGNGNTLTNTGSVPYVTGAIGNAANFSAMDATNVLWISGTGMCGLNAATGNAYSVAFLFNSNQTPGAGNGVGRVFDMGGTGFITFQYRWNGSAPQLDVSTGSGTGITYVHTFPTGTWHLIVLTCGTDNVTRLYVDNVQVGSNGTNGGVASGVNFGVGNANNSPGSNANSTGAKLDAMGVWQQELSSVDRGLLWNGGAFLQYPFVIPSLPPKSLINMQAVQRAANY